MEFYNNFDESLKKFSDSCKKIYGDDLDIIIQSTKDRKEIKKKRYYKTQHLIQLINMVDGKEVHHLDFIDKDDNWLNHHIDYYEYALSLKK